MTEQGLTDEYRGFFICIYWSTYSKPLKIQLQYRRMFVVKFRAHSLNSLYDTAMRMKSNCGFRDGEAICWPHEQISPYHICSSSGQDAVGDTRLTPKAQLPAQELVGSPLFNLLPVKGVGTPLKVDYQKHMITLSLQRPWFHLVLTWLMLMDCLPIWSRRINHFLSRM